jgi:hypothetical protein
LSLWKEPRGRKSKRRQEEKMRPKTKIIHPITVTERKREIAKREVGLAKRTVAVTNVGNKEPQKGGSNDKS